jgi:hypothetical protein
MNISQVLVILANIINTMKKIFAIASALSLCTILYAQNNTALERISSYKKLAREKYSALNSIAFRNVGPSIMSGRVTDIDINPKNPNEFYVAYASGGVWHSNNNGQSLTPIFDNEATITIGDIAVNWAEKIIWIGTGECNSSRSSYAGTGIYKSIDSGKHWQHCGLENTQHVAKIILTKNKNTIYVASVGPLYSLDNNAEGVFKTIDGGATWTKKNFPANAETNRCIDLMIDAKNENTIYACAWQRTRTAWQFTGNGNGSCIYKSTNAGDTWQCITGEKSGLPKNDGIGRIGIAQCKDKPNIMYALVDNQNRQAASTLQKNELTALQVKAMDATTFLKVDNKKLDEYLRNNNYDKKYKSESVKKDITNKKFTVQDVANWVLSDADAALFQTPVIGAELYKSTDAGATWIKTHTKIMEGLYFTYGYYFGNVTVNPHNENDVYLIGFTILNSKNGGATFKEITKENCHADNHRLWINDADTNHLIIGNDGGINITYDGGKKWFKGNNPAVGQFYAITTDNATPYNVYGGLQDNGTWVGPSTYADNNEWHQQGAYAYKEIGGGDGMQVQIDTRDNTTVYSGYQYGFYQRANIKVADIEPVEIHPTFDIGEQPLRYNWQSPFTLSKHNQDIVYMGANCFYRSMDKGKTMVKLSKDLAVDSKNKRGNVPYGTLTTIAESPKQFGLIYCGTDDGNIWRSKDVGNSFEKININEKGLWVSRIIASKYTEGTVYASLNGYRTDDFTPYLYVSNNYGLTWKNISGNLPMEPINVIREDPMRKNIIYVGTDNGLYVSFDNGLTYNIWNKDLPRVAIHDIAIQERDNDIILGTHGRSIYIASLNEIQIMDSINKIGNCIVYISECIHSDNWGKAWAVYATPNEPKIKINFYSTDSCSYTCTIKNDKKKLIQILKGHANKGFNTTLYNASIAIENIKNNKNYMGNNEVYYVMPGKYIAEIKLSSDIMIKKEFEIKADKPETK